VIPVFISALRDKSPDVVVRASDSIGEIAQLLGPVAVSECTTICAVLYATSSRGIIVTPAIIEAFSSILQQKAPCQTNFTEGDELENEGTP
jgi:hypothetical protein